MTLAALTNETIGWTIFIVILGGVITYAAINILRASKAELGAEIELAPNRKPYLPDEELEGPKLDRTLTIALLVLFVIAVGLPLYWILEPGRQAGATADFRKTFEDRGAAMFAPVGTSLDALGCEGCHGPKGSGGTTSYNLQEPDGSVKVVNWRVPALNTVLLRYSRQEVTYVITYGRQFSPMPAWGVAGGGALNDQQVQNLVDYLESIQITPDQAQQAAKDELAKMMAEKNPDGTPKWSSEGEALFNLGFDDGFAGGAYACARCHTQNWSYTTDYSQVKDFAGCGALGPSLCGGSETRQFPPNTGPDACPSNEPGATTTTTTAPPGASTTTTTTTTAPSSSSSSSGSSSSAAACTNPIQDHIDFVTTGSEDGKKYGVHGQGTGKMPGFGASPQEPITYTNPDGAQVTTFYINGGKPRDSGPGMLPPDMIESIVDYERSLP
jgi:mono/diheme cytochrome c family protein